MKAERTPQAPAAGGAWLCLVALAGCTVPTPTAPTPTGLEALNGRRQAADHAGEQGVSVVMTERDGELQLSAALATAATLGLRPRAGGRGRTARGSIRAPKPPAPPRVGARQVDARWCAEVRAATGKLVARTCAAPDEWVHLAPDERHQAPAAAAPTRRRSVRLKLPWVAGGRLQVRALGQSRAWSAP